MDPPVSLVVTDEVDAFDPYRAFDGKLEDRGRHGAAPELESPLRADVNRDDSAHEDGNALKIGVMPDERTRSARSSISRPGGAAVTSADVPLCAATEEALGADTEEEGHF